MPPHRTRIKICGITSVDDASAAVEAGADAIGLVFVKRSPRRIDLDRAIEICDAVVPFVTVIGVFQIVKPHDPDLDEWWGEWVQLHGSEDEALVEQIAQSHKVIRGFAFSNESVRRWSVCAHVESLLVDGSAGGGGTGFRHEELAVIMPSIGKPVIIAGGLHAENVGGVIAAVRPFAVDVSTGVESEPGVKDAQKIRAFCAAVRRADAQLAERHSD